MIVGCVLGWCSTIRFSNFLNILFLIPEVIFHSYAFSITRSSSTCYSLHVSWTSPIVYLARFIVKYYFKSYAIIFLISSSDKSTRLRTILSRIHFPPPLNKFIYCARSYENLAITSSVSTLYIWKWMILDSNFPLILFMGKTTIK